MRKRLSVSVVGLGKLGCPLAACFGAKGYRVIGVDLDERAVDCVNRSLPPTFEPGLDELLLKAQHHLSATRDCAEAVAETDVTFIVVPTPSGPDGTFTNKYVLDACEGIAKGLAAKNSYHLVVIVSTVMPGSTGGEIQRQLEDRSGKKCGPDFGLCYGPTFVALGSVIQNFLYPDYLLIGEADSRSGDVLEKLYNGFCENNPPTARMNFINAELTKLANNTFVSTKITFGNMLAQICEHLPEADVDVVTSALGLDSRIGEKYLRGGFGYGGPCLARDNVALTVMADEIGAHARLAEATDEANRQEVVRLIDLIRSRRAELGVVGVLGLSYKPETDVIEDSQGMLLAQALAGGGAQVVAYDPAAMDHARRIFENSVELAESAEDCVRRSDVVVIATPWQEFRRINPEWFASPGDKLLIDCWRILESSQFRAVAEYVGLGLGPTARTSVSAAVQH